MATELNQPGWLPTFGTGKEPSELNLYKPTMEEIEMSFNFYKKINRDWGLHQRSGLTLGGFKMYSIITQTNLEKNENNKNNETYKKRHNLGRQT